MSNLIMLGAAVIAMYRLAEIENENGGFWAFTTLIVCLVTSSVLKLPMLDIFIGFVLSFAAFYVVKMRRK